MGLAVYVPARVGEGYFTDWIAPAAGATDNNKVWIWNNTTGKYTQTTTLTSFTLVTPTISGTGFANANHAHTGSTSGGTLDHGAALTGLADDDHTQYLLATGSRAGASAAPQTFTNGIVGPSWKPASNSITAAQIQNAAGTAILNIDTTNGRLGINNSAPAGPLDASGAGASTIERTSTTVNTSLSAMQIGIGGSVGHGTGGPALLFYANNSTPAKGFIGRLSAAWENSTAGSEAGAVTISTRLNSADTNAATERLRITSAGLVGLSTAGPTAWLDIPASTADQASLRMRSATVDPTVINDGEIWRNGGFNAFAVIAGTTANVDFLTLNRSNASSTGNGFGAGIHVKLKSNTVVGESAGKLTYWWAVASNSVRASYSQWSTFYTTTENPSITIGSNSSGALLGFYNVTTPIAKPTSGANLTNNVTAGGTDDTISNWTDLTTYATDAAAIRNAIYQLARKTKQLNDGLRALGLMT